MTASRHADDAVPPGKCRRKIVEHVRRITTAGQEEQGRAGTAPIEHLKLDVLCRWYELHPMRRWVSPSRFLGGAPNFEWKP